ncbi:hypothetical protein M427DRAFT_153395 [Gonapodya prolifera JEL478]|uniref:MHD1 domain-containing protein n=1 Tax=Gonapodya prolifera (strain JEL478) TaxID=1344416 RepID=A0A139ANC4_GONPJ|nr:hypothetical protein M427DRAFT_153395 [Gonapodya prolifera JEL478]|eukprot:KXS18242.1 hypothetical protein M427DRAFT_153395 [Gonapodya prolifera JEL478]
MAHSNPGGSLAWENGHLDEDVEPPGASAEELQELLRVAHKLARTRNQMTAHARQVKVMELYSQVLKSTLLPICTGSSAPEPPPIMIPPETLNAFMRQTYERYSLLADLRGSNSHFQVFVRSAKSLLNGVLTPSAIGTGVLDDLKSLFMVIGSQVDLQVRRLASDSTAHDYHLINAMDMYANLLREAIDKTHPDSVLPSLGEVRNYKPLIRKLLANLDDMDEFGDMALANWAKSVFRANDRAHGKVLNEIIRGKTTKFALAEFRTVPDIFESGRVVGFSEKDFLTPEGWHAFLRMARDKVQRVLVACTQRWPEMSVVPPSIHRGSFFIPPDPFSYFRVLYRLCIDHDAPARGSPSLSTLTSTLLTECGDRWFIPPLFRELCHAENVVRLLGVSGVSVSLVDVCIALQRVVPDVESRRADLSWPELGIYIHVLRTAEVPLRRSLMYLVDAAADAADQSSKHTIDMCANALLWIYGDETWVTWSAARVADMDLPRFAHEITAGLGEDLDGAVKRIQQLVLDVVLMRYNRLMDESSKIDEVGETDVAKVARLAKIIRHELQAYIVAVPELLDGLIRVDSLAWDHIYAKRLAFELSNVQLKENDSNDTISDLLELYRIVHTLKTEISISDDGSGLDLDGWFAPYVVKWLDIAENRTAQWVYAALAADEFRAVAPPSSLYSSSLDEIFHSFHQTLEFIETLDWEDQVTKAKFLARIARVMQKALDLYVERLTASFWTVVNRRESITSKAQIVWTPEYYVRLNNLLDSLRRISDIELVMNAPFHASVLAERRAVSPPPIPSTAPATYSLLLVKGRALSVGKSTTGLFEYSVVVQSVGELGRRPSLQRGASAIGKGAATPQPITRSNSVVSATGDPNWNELITITTAPDSKPFTLLDLEIRRKAQPNGTEERIGKFSLFLPFTEEAALSSAGSTVNSGLVFRLSSLGDYAGQECEVVFDKDRQSRIIMRIWKNGAEQDPQVADNLGFWLGRARSDVDRGLADALDAVKEHVARFVRGSLQKAIETLTSPEGSANTLENSVAPIAAYLDETFGILNTWLDPGVGEWASQRLGPYDLPASFKRWKIRRAALLERMLNGSMTPVDRMDNSSDVARVPPHPFIIQIYNAIVRAVYNALRSSGIERWSPEAPSQGWSLFRRDEKARADSEKTRSRRRKVASCVLDAMGVFRSLLLCEINGQRNGFDWIDLETPEWRQLRDFLLPAIDADAPKMVRSAEGVASQARERMEAITMAASRSIRSPGSPRPSDPGSPALSAVGSFGRLSRGDMNGALSPPNSLRHHQGIADNPFAADIREFSVTSPTQHVEAPTVSSSLSNHATLAPIPPQRARSRSPGRQMPQHGGPAPGTNVRNSMHWSPDPTSPPPIPTPTSPTPLSPTLTQYGPVSPRLTPSGSPALYPAPHEGYSTLPRSSDTKGSGRGGPSRERGRSPGAPLHGYSPAAAEPHPINPAPTPPASVWTPSSPTPTATSVDTVLAPPQNDEVIEIRVRPRGVSADPSMDRASRASFDGRGLQRRSVSRDSESRSGSSRLGGGLEPPSPPMRGLAKDTQQPTSDATRTSSSTLQPPGDWGRRVNNSEAPRSNQLTSPRLNATLRVPSSPLRDSFAASDAEGDRQSGESEGPQLRKALSMENLTTWLSPSKWGARGRSRSPNRSAEPPTSGVSRGDPSNPWRKSFSFESQKSMDFMATQGGPIKTLDRGGNYSANQNRGREGPDFLPSATRGPPPSLPPGAGGSPLRSGYGSSPEQSPPPGMRRVVPKPRTTSGVMG